MYIVRAGIIWHTCLVHRERKLDVWHRESSPSFGLQTIGIKTRAYSRPCFAKLGWMRISVPSWGLLLAEYLKGKYKIWKNVLKRRLASRRLASDHKACCKGRLRKLFIVLSACRHCGIQPEQYGQRCFICPRYDNLTGTASKLLGQCNVLESM